MIDKDEFQIVFLEHYLKREFFIAGEYKVNLPDGRVQTVSYRADPVQGFVADVKYEVNGRHCYNPKIRML